ncbi:DNA-methyltransferase [Ruminococcus albus]|uniref:Methyltransferase n=1 Tax=Ruminococcus albus TaxID=1264 RepID=A0A1I1CWG8_RUMAL|nr:site-specific DNA-methyltransferase [Ruminococcus albus]SFB66396.1 site-specific DNA-methyltransferase (adenine-specific) [Ruminococcus albus]
MSTNALTERGVYISNIKLKNESCFDLLPTIPNNSVSLVLIDPPYDISRETNFANGEPRGRDNDRFRITMDFGEWDSSFQGIEKVVRESYRILRSRGTFISFYDLWKITKLKDTLEETGFKQIRFVEWLKTNPVPINSNVNYLTNAREAAVAAVKNGKPTFHSKYDDGIYRFPICHDKGRFHPTQKPLALFQSLVLKHSNAGDTVLDCFSGSGTTAAACGITSRDFIGCEIN